MLKESNKASTDGRKHGFPLGFWSMHRIGVPQDTALKTGSPRIIQPTWRAPTGVLAKCTAVDVAPNATDYAYVLRER